jgi:hypothetical protein
MDIDLHSESDFFLRQALLDAYRELDIGKEKRLTQENIKGLIPVLERLYAEKRRAYKAREQVDLPDLLEYHTNINSIPVENRERYNLLRRTVEQNIRHHHLNHSYSGKNIPAFFKAIRNLESKKVYNLTKRNGRIPPVQRNKISPNLKKAFQAVERAQLLGEPVPANAIRKIEDAYPPEVAPRREAEEEVEGGPLMPRARVAQANMFDEEDAEAGAGHYAQVMSDGVMVDDGMPCFGRIRLEPGAERKESALALLVATGAVTGAPRPPPYVATEEEANAEAAAPAPAVGKLSQHTRRQFRVSNLFKRPVATAAVEPDEVPAAPAQAPAQAPAPAPAAAAAAAPAPAAATARAALIAYALNPSTKEGARVAAAATATAGKSAATAARSYAEEQQLSQIARQAATVAAEQNAAREAARAAYMNAAG